MVITLAALLAALGSLVTIPGDGADAASLNAAGWTTNAAPTSVSAAAGTTATLSVTVKSNSTRRALVDLEVHSSTGKVFQQYWDNQSFTRGVTRTFTAKWKIPANQPVGTYTVKVGMLGVGWNPFQHWNGSAGTVKVTSPATTTTTTTPPTTTPPTTTPPTTTTTTTTVPPSTTTTTTTTTVPPTTTTTVPPSTTTTTTMPPTTTTAPPTTTTTTVPPATTAVWITSATPVSVSAAAGTTATVSISVQSSTTRRALVDVEVHSSTGTVFQQYWDDQSFTAGVSRTFTGTWAIPADQPAGTYTVKIGMFGVGWNPFLHWNGSAGTVTVTAPPATTPPGSPAPSSSRLNWMGADFYASGVNVPWMTWPWAPGHGDFGGGTNNGVVANSAAIGAGFAKLQASGTRVARWWTFSADAWQINRNADGWPTSLNPAVYADFDAAISLADQYDLYYNFVLFSGPDDFPSTWRTDPAQRVQLAKVLAPLFERYKDNPRVMSWEIFNEPEWAIWNSGGRVTEAHVKALAVEIIKSIRVNSPKKLVTVGQALVGGYNSSQRGIAMWTDVDLDFYSPHWYGSQTSPFSICALCTTAPDLQALYNTTKPIVIGEFDSGLLSNSQNVARLNQWYDKGYAGAWGWSLFHELTHDKIPIDWAAQKTFNAQHSDIGPKTP